jgi:hypothetical protein
MALIDQVLIVLEASVMAAVYSGLFYAKHWQQAKEPFEWQKFAATLAVGIVVGVVAALSGGEVFQADIETKLVAYAGAIALIETILKLGYRSLRGVGEPDVGTPT